MEKPINAKYKIQNANPSFSGGKKIKKRHPDPSIPQLQILPIFSSIASICKIFSSGKI